MRRSAGERLRPTFVAVRFFGRLVLLSGAARTACRHRPAPRAVTASTSSTFPCPRAIESTRTAIGVAEAKCTARPAPGERGGAVVELVVLAGQVPRGQHPLEHRAEALLKSPEGGTSSPGDPPSSRFDSQPSLFKVSSSSHARQMSSSARVLPVEAASRSRSSETRVRRARRGHGVAPRSARPSSFRPARDGSRGRGNGESAR